MGSSRASKTNLAIIVLMAGAAWIASKTMTKAPQAPVEPTRSGSATLAMIETERIAYVAQHIAVLDMAIGYDTEPESEKRVPGLMRVSGMVENRGEREIHKVIVQVTPLDEQDEAMGSYFEDVVGRGPLAPGESRRFSFLIPDKAGFSGRFEHKVR